MVASTLPQRDEFTAEGVNNSSYQTRHSKMIFEEGFSFSGFERDKFWLSSADGQWHDVSNISGADDDDDGRALVFADFDDDGDSDFFVHNIQRERHRLYRNDVGNQAGNGWIKVRLTATAGHPSAAGAVVHSIRGEQQQAKLMAYGSGFLSQNAPELVFGLGGSETAEIEVQWPGRERESFGAHPAGSRLQLIEGSGKAELIAARTFQFPEPAHPGLKLHLGDRVSSLPLVAADGSAVDFGLEGHGRPVIVNFWATYCTACVAELGDLQELHDKGEWFVVLIGMDQPEDREKALEMLAERDIGLEHYFWSNALVETALDPERMPLPTSLFLSDESELQEVLQAPIHDWSGWDWDSEGGP